MTKRNVGVGSKVFIGSIALILIGVVIGAVGFLSLGKVTSAGNVNVSSEEVRSKILEARILEKEYISKKDEESYNKLLRCLDELAASTSGLQARMRQDGSVAEITTAQQDYKQAMAEVKRLEEDNVKVVKELQSTGESIATVAEDETAGATSATKSKVLDINGKVLKDYSQEEIRGIVALGYNILQFYHDQGMSKEVALELVRNLHFDTTNYFFVVQEDLILVAHGSDRSLEGKNFGEIQDKKTGRTFMKEVVGEAIKNGESSTEYFWNKPGMGDAIFSKVTCGKYFEPWRLVICAGIYTDDVEKQLGKTAEAIQAGLDKLQQANDIKTLLMQARLDAANYFLFGKNEQNVSKNISQLKGLAISSDGLKQKANAYLETFNHWVRNNEALQKNVIQIDTLAGATIRIANETGRRAMSALMDSVASGRQFILGFMLAGALVGLLFATLMTRAITGPIRRIVDGLAESSQQVSAGSNQISGASQELAEGASQQAAAIEQTSSSLEQMSSMTRQNADNARQAEALMTETGQVVSIANNSMSLLTASMTEISKASEETSKIIKTIDEIAFQTNLLALNAAVEAARAGEAGSGFAVVADEVRNLAMRAAEAAKNTADLIEGTVKKIHEGAEIVERTSVEFSRVESSAVKMSGLVGEIAAASSEQSQGIEQLNRAVSEIDKVIQRNASNAEESASASQEMKAQAAQMTGFVSGLVALVDGKTDGAA